MLELVPGQIFASDFRVVRPLNKGGMGAVYVVEQLSTQLPRALKLMHPELVRDPRLRQRFEQEARIGGQIASDHIAQVISAGIDPASGTPWLAMELLQGETLAEWIQRRRTSLRELFEIFAQLCHGLGAAHARGIVHRDLKPENIFVAVPRQAGLPFFIKVLDFGIAKMTSQHGTGSTTTSMGTPLWMAPEQTDNGRVGPATDVWALGLIAFSLLTQRPYWLRGNQEDTTLPALMREILFEPLVPASQRARELGIVLDAEQAFDAWFARCVAREPNARFANAAEAHSALVSWLSQPLANAPQGYPAGATAPGAPPAFSASFVEPVPPTIGSGTELPGAQFPLPGSQFSGVGARFPLPTPPGVTERGVSETLHGAPKGRGLALGLAALGGGIVVAGLAGLAFHTLKPGASTASACAAEEVRAADGQCACPAGSTKSGDHCVPLALAACPAGQTRKEAGAACLCANGSAPGPSGECASPACSPSADQAVIRAALKQAEASGRERCHALNPANNSGTITITVSPNGHVTEANIEGALAGSEGARCLSDIFLSTAVACFAGDPVKLKKNIALP